LYVVAAVAAMCDTSGVFLASKKKFRVLPGATSELWVAVVVAAVTSLRKMEFEFESGFSTSHHSKPPTGTTVAVVIGAIGWMNSSPPGKANPPYDPSAIWNPSVTPIAARESAEPVPSC